MICLGFLVSNIFYLFIYLIVFIDIYQNVIQQVYVFQSKASHYNYYILVITTYNRYII